LLCGARIGCADELVAAASSRAMLGATLRIELGIIKLQIQIRDLTSASAEMPHRVQRGRDRGP
jgi:hypothetical protein